MGSNGLPWARLWADLLEDPAYLGLSDSAKLLCHHGLMWWMAEGTWGRIPGSVLTRLLPGTSTRTVQRLANELVERGFWRVDADAFVDDRADRQVTHDELERNRRNAAERQARKRAKDRQERDSERDDPSVSRVTPGVDPGPVTRDSDRDVTRDSRRDPSTRVERENLRTGETPSSPHPSSHARRSKSKGVEEEAVAWMNNLNEALQELGFPPLKATGKAVAGAQARLRGRWRRGHLDAVTDKAVAAAKRGALTNPGGWVMWALTDGTTPDAPEVPDPTPPKPVSGISAAVRGAGTAVVQTDEASKREMELLALFSDETGESA